MNAASTRAMLARIWQNNGWLLVCLLVLFFYYDYPGIDPIQPQGPHTWRQSDGASLAWHYYSETLNLFAPRIHNQILNDGHTVGEFPIVYYLVGVLNRIFGPSDLIFRLVSLGLLWIGLFALSRTVQRIVEDRFWATVIPIALFSSPVLVFYAYGFMPEPPALGMALVGWSYFFRFRDSQSNRDFLWAMVFFTLATLMKVSMGISLICVGALYFIEWNQWTGFGKGNSHLFSQPRWRYALYFAGGLLLVAAWYAYAAWYNAAHNVHYFRTDPITILETKQGDFQTIFYRFFTELNEAAFYPFTHVVVLFLLGMALTRHGRQYPLLFAITLLSFLGVFLYGNLFYQLFIVHDYFLMPMLIFPLWIFIHGAVMLKEGFPKLNQSWVFKGLVLVLLGINVYHAHFQTWRCYHKDRQFQEHPAYYEPGLQAWLSEIGIQPDDKVISLPDPSPNITLYLLQRKGWSGYSARMIPEHIRLIQRKGATYLLVPEGPYRDQEALQPMLTQPLGSFHGLHAYRLPESE